MQGHFAKHNLPPVKFMREVMIEVEGPNKDPTNAVVKVGDRVLVIFSKASDLLMWSEPARGTGFRAL